MSRRRVPLSHRVNTMPIATICALITTLFFGIVLGATIASINLGVTP